MTMPGGPDPTMPTPPVYGGGGPGSKKIWMVAGTVLVVGLLVGAAVAVLATSDDSDSASTTSSSTSTSTTSTTKPTAAPGATAGPPSATPTTVAPTTVAIPTILTFNVEPNFVQCAGQDIVLVKVIWTTQNAVDVTVRIDNGPSVNHVPNSPAGGQSKPYACGSAPHTFYIVANGPGGLKSDQRMRVVNKV